MFVYFYAFPLSTARLPVKEVNCYSFAHALLSFSYLEMAQKHKRRHGATDVTRLSAAESSSRGASSSEDASRSVFAKLLAAGFYGLSSFLIVVVNKSVLTSYRYKVQATGSSNIVQISLICT